MIDNQLQIDETDPKLIALIERLRKTPLTVRLDKSYKMMAKIFAENRRPRMSIPTQYDDEDFYIAQTLVDAAEAMKLIENPIDMLLFCPNCGEQHVDEAKPDECETCGRSETACICETFTAWLNPSHKSHRCGRCNHVFRPADVPTNGVKAIKTAGEHDGVTRPRYTDLDERLGAAVKQIESLENDTSVAKLIESHYQELDALRTQISELNQEIEDCQAGCIHCGHAGEVEVKGEMVPCECPSGQVITLQAEIERLRDALSQQHAGTDAIWNEKHEVMLQVETLGKDNGTLRAQLSDAKSEAKNWEGIANQYAHAWQRELNFCLIPKTHLIDSLVLTTRQVFREKSAAEKGCEDLKEIKKKLDAHFDGLPGGDVFTGVDQLLNEVTECQHYIDLIRELFDYGDEPIDLATYLIGDVAKLKDAARQNGAEWWSLFTNLPTKILAQKLASEVVERSGEENPQQCALLREAIFHAICKAVDVADLRIRADVGAQTRDEIIEQCKKIVADVFFAHREQPGELSLHVKMMSEIHKLKSGEPTPLPLIKESEQ